MVYVPKFCYVIEIPRREFADLVAPLAIVHVREILQRIRIGAHAVTLKTGRVSLLDCQLRPPDRRGFDDLMAIGAFHNFAGVNRYISDAGRFIGYALNFKVRRQLFLAMIKMREVYKEVCARYAFQYLVLFLKVEYRCARRTRVADAAIGDPSAEILVCEIVTTGASGVSGEIDYVDLLGGDSVTVVAILLMVRSLVSEAGALFCRLGREKNGGFVAGRGRGLRARVGRAKVRAHQKKAR